MWGFPLLLNSNVEVHALHFSFLLSMSCTIYWALLLLWCLALHYTLVFLQFQTLHQVFFKCQILHFARKILLYQDEWGAILWCILFAFNRCWTFIFFSWHVVYLIYSMTAIASDLLHGRQCTWSTPWQVVYLIYSMTGSVPDLLHDR